MVTLKDREIFSLKIASIALAGVAQWIEWFRSQLGHLPGLRASSPVRGTRELKRQPHTDVSSPLFLPPFPSL